MNDAVIAFSAGDDSAPSRPVSPDAPPKYPYPGLRPFKTEEAAIFYGRNAQKDAILERLNQSRMVFILGSSGCGKSSLIKAGVIPALKAGLLTKQGYDWQVIVMRPGRRPLVNLAEAFSQTREFQRERVRAKSAEVKPKAESAGGQAKPKQPPGRHAASGATEFLSCFENEDEGLWSATSMLPDALGEGSRKNTIRYLLLVDQFEEIFDRQIENSAEVDRFVKLLTAQYARPHPALFVIFTMRSDYLGNCSSFPGLSEAVNNCSYLTPILTASELREAIERPAQDYGANVEQQLVDEILAEMHSGTNYDSDSLPLMQHALLWLWQRTADAEPQKHSDGVSRLRLTAKDYQAFGGMKGILKKHADETLRIAEGEKQEFFPIAESLFRRLSEQDDEGRFRRCPATFAEIGKIGGCREDELEHVVLPFSDERATFVEIRPAETPGERLLDVSHEALIRTWDRARDWAVLERQKVEKFRGYLGGATAWKDADQNSKSLEGQPGLDEFERWWQGTKPSGGWYHRYFASDTDARRIYSSAEDAVAWVDRYRRASLKADRFRKLRTRALEALAVALAILLPSYAAYTAHVNAEKARAQAIADRAEYSLGNEGPAEALLVATQAEKLGLPDLPKTERVLIAALRQLRERWVISGLSNPVFGIAYSQDGSVIASLDNASIVFRGAEKGDFIAAVPLPAPAKFGLTWSAAGDWIGVNYENSALLLRPCSHKEISHLFTSCQPGGEDQSVTLGGSLNAGGLPRFSSDGKWAVTASRIQPPVLWDIATGNAKPLTTKIPFMPFDVAISPDGKRIAVGLANSEIYLVDPISGDTIRPLTPKTEKSANVLAVEFNPKDPNMLAASLQNGDILIWNIGDGSYQTLIGSGGIAYNLSFSRDGQYLAASSDDRVIRTWSTDKLKLKDKPIQLRGHAGPVYVVAYSPVSNTLVSGSADKTIRIWDEHGPLWRDEKDGARPDIGTKPRELPPWLSSVTLPYGFGEVAGYAREGDRAVVASKEGNLARFMLGADARAIVRWRAPGEIAVLAIEHNPDRIVAVSPSGKRYSWPFFPSIRELVRFADDHIPFDGDRRLTLSDDEKCAISPPEDGCPSDDALSDTP